MRNVGSLAGIKPDCMKGASTRLEGCRCVVRWTERRTKCVGIWVVSLSEKSYFWIQDCGDDCRLSPIEEMEDGRS